MSTDLFEDLGVNGHDVLGARRNRQGETVYVTRPGDMPRLGWLRRGARRERQPRRAGRPGAGMIGTATALLFALGAGLLGVSLAAQYRYLLHERHQHAAALVEALALDVGMLIFSLLALGLARSGKSARVERALIVACAAGSGVMNFAAADDASLRSILAYCMPPVFLAVVADRVISVVRRHYLGDEEHSAWTGLGRAALYGLRFTVAAPSTLGGARRALLTATPLPAIEAPAAGAAAPGASDLAPGLVLCSVCGHPTPQMADGSAGAHSLNITSPGNPWCPGGYVEPARENPPAPSPDAAEVLPRLEPLDGTDDAAVPPFVPVPPRPAVAVPPVVQLAPDLPPLDGPPQGPREGTKTAELLRLAAERYPGGLAAIDLADTARIAAALAPEVDMHPGSARTALRSAVLAAQAGGAR